MPRVRAARTPSRRTASPDHDGLGSPIGNRRRLTLHLPADAVEILQRATANEGLPRGAVVCQAIVSSIDELRATYGVTSVDPAWQELLGTPGKERRRVGLESPRQLPVTVAEQEAEGIDKLRTELRLSASKLVTEALRLRYAGAETPR
jgi:hypothetical protein